MTKRREEKSIDQQNTGKTTKSKRTLLTMNENLIKSKTKKLAPSMKAVKH